MLLNVVNILLVMVVYICSKNNIIHDPTRAFTTYLLLPAFILLTLGLLVLTGVAGIAALFNADFCQGGPGGEDYDSTNNNISNNKSPQGTLRDAILSFEYGTLDTDRQLEGSMALVYDSFAYYSNVSKTKEK